MKRAAAIALVLACVASAGLAAGCGGGKSKNEANVLTPGQVIQKFRREVGEPLQRAAVPDEAWEQLGLGLDPSHSDVVRYGIFSLYVAKSGHLKALDSLLRDKATRKPLARGPDGIYWELDSDSETWVAYKRYAGNVVLVWFSGSRIRAADARWQRLDRVFSSLAG